MHQTRKGQYWYFWMKAHIGMDMYSDLVHTVTTTAANGIDVTQVDQLLYEEKKIVHGDADYTGAQHRVPRNLECNIAEKRGRVKAIPEGPVKESTQALKILKA